MQQQKNLSIKAHSINWNFSRIRKMKRRNKYMHIIASHTFPEKVVQTLKKIISKKYG